MEQLTRLDIVVLDSGVMKLRLAKPSSAHEEVVRSPAMLLGLLMLPGLGQKSAARSTPGRLTVSNTSLALHAKIFYPGVLGRSRRLRRHRAVQRLQAPGATSPVGAGRPHSRRVAARDVVVNLTDPRFVKCTEFCGCFPMNLDIKPFAADCYPLRAGRRPGRSGRRRLRSLSLLGFAASLMVRASEIVASTITRVVKFVSAFGSREHLGSKIAQTTSAYSYCIAIFYSWDHFIEISTHHRPLLLLFPFLRD